MIINGFVYIWEYMVKEEFLEEFNSIYGPTGDWAKLFRKAEGYLTTELHQDISDPRRFITVDYWNSKEDRDRFRRKFANEFNDLDEHCERFTSQEKFIGDFNSISNRIPH